jgi:2-keto-3-deoxygluconate permease
MRILKTIRKIPGGLMVVPFFLGVLVNSFFPQVLDIGGFTSHLWKVGAMPILAMFLFCNGAQINVKQAGKPLYKGVVLTLSKFLIGAFIGIVINKIWGPAGVLGLTPLAIIAAITNSNGGLYSALAGEYGDSSDVGAVSILAINDGPFLTMIAFGLTGIGDIPFIMLIATILPIVVGCVLGNMDDDLRKWLAPGTVILIPFFAFPLGAGLHLSQLINAGVPGIVLGLICTIFTGFGGYWSMKLIRSDNPHIGAAIGTTAGNAAATPAALALADTTFMPYADVAIVQIAAAIIVTAIFCPILVNILYQHELRLRKKKNSINP